MRDAIAAARRRFGATQPLLIGDERITDRDLDEVRYPADPSLLLGKVARGTKADVDTAVAAARHPFPAWRDRPAAERADILRKAASILESRRYELAALMVFEPFGAANIAVLLALTFAAAGTMAVDQPARTASTPDIVGRDDLSNAVTLQMVAQQLAFPLALPLVGILNDQFAAGTVYCLTLTVWLAILPLIGLLRFRSIGEANRAESMLANIRDGLRYARADATIFGVMGIVFTLQILGMPGVATLGPLWMTKVLGLSPAEVGFMVTTWGLGTFA